MSKRDGAVTGVDVMCERAFRNNIHHNCCCLYFQVSASFMYIIDHICCCISTKFLKTEGPFTQCGSGCDFFGQQAKSVHIVRLWQPPLSHDATAAATQNGFHYRSVSVNDSICYNVIQLLRKKTATAAASCERTLKWQKM